jgi:diguanylate cyclase (GGDEF)-like protein/PAS domain S-box-containing protein
LSEAPTNETKVAHTRRVPRWSRLLYGFGMTTLAVLYVALPSAPRYLYTMIGVLSVVAMTVGIAVNKPRRRLPWRLVTCGVAALIVGDATYDVLTDVLGYHDPFPSLADVVFLAMYPLLAVGLLLMIRARGGSNDRHALVDAVIITVGVGLLVWVFLAEPYMQDSTLTWVEKAFSVAYPLGDVLLLAVLAHLLMTGGAQPWSLRLLTIGTVGLLVSDVIYGFIQLNGDWRTGGPVEIGWIVFYGAWGAANLQPDMARLAEPARSAPRVMSRPRLLMLGSVSLMAPGLLLWESHTGSYHDVGTVAAASASLFVLVALRLSGVIEIARQSTQRESILRRTGEALVAASGRDEVYAVGALAVSQITESAAGHRVLVGTGAHGVLRLVYDSGRPDGSVAGLDLADLVERHGADLERHQFVLSESDRCGAVVRARLGAGVSVLVAAMLRDGAVSGVLVVAGDGVERADIIDAVCAMASQMLLALESADLTEQALKRRNDAHFRSLIQNASDIIFLVDADLAVVYQTPSAQAVLGWSSEVVLGQPLESLVVVQDLGRAKALLRRAVSSSDTGTQSTVLHDEWRLCDDGAGVRAFEVSCRNLFDDPSVQALVLTLHDVTEQRQLESKLTHMAFHDALTQLPNRSLFLDRVEHSLARQGRHRERIAVMIIDLDDFKLVNDSRGHAAGDDLLVQVSNRLTSLMRSEDTCARLAGDEFAVLVEGLVDDDEARQLAVRIVKQLRMPYRIGDDQCLVGASVGLSTSDYGINGAELLQQADLAMYAAKEAGKSTYELYRPSLQDVMHARVRLGNQLALAVERQEFRAHYQPIVDLRTGRVLAVESLVRWQHPDQGLLLPASFIAAVEDSDLVLDVGAWMLEAAVAQAARWQRYAPEGQPLRMSVNVAPRQLQEPGFVDVVIESLHRHAVRADVLILEITERVLADQDPQIVVAMARLQELGVRLAVDDFGTGYSALGYLRRFPVSTLKIDRSFVAGLGQSVDDRSLVEAIIRLGETFGLGLVAEGIETEMQRDALVGLGCRQGQGFLFARALSAEHAEAYIAGRVAHLDDVPAVLEPPRGQALVR